MRRKRFQKGSLQKRLSGGHYVWLVMWREAEKRPSKTLGRCADLTKSQAQQMLARILEPINQGVQSRTNRAITFEDFVDGVFLPHKRLRWKESTAMTSEQIIQCHLMPDLGQRLLQSIHRTDLQALLARKAPTHSRSVINHLRWFLKDIFGLAISDGLLSANPATNLEMPKTALSRAASRALTAAEVVTFFSALGFRERLIAKLAVLAGMRPGEILGLHWGAIQHGIATIDCRVYRGKFDTPKNGLSREAALGAEIESDLRRWAETSTNRAADALVFPSEKGTPLLRDNLWRRFFKPRLEPVGLAWATFQVLRATNASLKHEAGVDPKVAADQRGHGLGVSLEVYTRSSRDQKKEAVGKLESMLARNRKQKQSA